MCTIRDTTPPYIPITPFLRNGICHTLYRINTAGLANKHVIWLIMRLNRQPLALLLNWGRGLALSSALIASRVDKLICLDKFQHLAKSPYCSDKYSVGDEFYFSFPRLETFMANVVKASPLPGNQVSCVPAYMQGDIYKNLDVLIHNNTKIDMFFIDFEKNMKRLRGLLQKLTHHYPDAVIVGDDYVFDSVKQATRGFRIYYNSMSYVLGINKYDYTAYPYRQLDYFLRNIKTFTFERVAELQESIIFSFVVHLMKTKQWNTILQNIQRIPFSWNKQSESMTLYHYFFYYGPAKDVVDILLQYEQVKHIKNAYLLTALDYRESGMDRFIN